MVVHALDRIRQPMRWPALVIGLLLLLAACGSPSDAPATATASPTPDGASSPPSTPPATERTIAECGEERDLSGRESGTVLVFFTCADAHPPASVYPLERPGPDSADPTARLTAALEALLEGPGSVEADRGYDSWFGPETAGMLNEASVNADGRAVADFAEFSGVIPNASTSAGSQMLLASLNATVFQYDEVTEIEYRFDGSCDAFWNWLQANCQVVTDPADGNGTADLPPFACDLLPAEDPGDSTHALIVDVRVGEHADFDRIVFEFEPGRDGTAGIPEWLLREADGPPRASGSGDPIEVAGERILHLTLIGGTKLTEDFELAYDGPTEFRPESPQLVEFIEGGDFEAVSDWYAGIDGEPCLRVFELDDPLRLVIDLEHP
jgi:hypothetical protein